MAAHRYWRLTDPNGGVKASGPGPGTSWQMGMAELHLRETSGGSNVIAAAGSTLSVSSGYDGSYTAGDLKDGSTGTDNEWVSAGESQPPTVTIDFGAGNSKEITEIVVYARPWFNGQEPGRPLMAWSDDGTSFTPDWYGITYTTWAPGDVRTFTRQSDLALTGGHRFWRLLVTDCGAGEEVGVAELRVRTGASTTDLAPLATVTASSENVGSNMRARFACDLLDETSGGGGWQSVSPLGAGQWIQLDFGPGAAPAISVVEVKARSFYAAHLAAPRQGAWQYSDDGSTWTTDFNFDEPEWTSGEVRVLESSIVDRHGAAVFAGASALVAAASVLEPVDVDGGAAVFAGLGTLVAAGALAEPGVVNGAAVFTGAGTLVAAGSASLPSDVFGAAAFAGAGAMRVAWPCIPCPPWENLAVPAPSWWRQYGCCACQDEAA